MLLSFQTTYNSHEKENFQLKKQEQNHKPLCALYSCSRAAYQKCFAQLTQLHCYNEQCTFTAEMVKMSFT